MATLQGSIVMMLGPGTLAAIMTHKKQNNHHKYCTHTHIKVRGAQNKFRECTLYIHGGDVMFWFDYASSV